MEGHRGAGPGINGEVYGRREKRERDSRRDTQGGANREKLEMNFAIENKHTEAGPGALGGTTKEGGGNRDYKVREAGNSDPFSPFRASEKRIELFFFFSRGGGGGILIPTLLGQQIVGRNVR